MLVHQPQQRWLTVLGVVDIVADNVEVVFVDCRVGSIGLRLSAIVPALATAAPQHKASSPTTAAAPHRTSSDGIGEEQHNCNKTHWAPRKWSSTRESKFTKTRTKASCEIKRENETANVWLLTNATETKDLFTKTNKSLVEYLRPLLKENTVRWSHN